MRPDLALLASCCRLAPAIAPAQHARRLASLDPQGAPSGAATAKAVHSACSCRRSRRRKQRALDSGRIVAPMASNWLSPWPKRGCFYEVATGPTSHTRRLPITSYALTLSKETVATRSRNWRVRGQHKARRRNKDSRPSQAGDTGRWREKKAERKRAAMAQQCRGECICGARRSIMFLRFTRSRHSHFSL